MAYYGPERRFIRDKVPVQFPIGWSPTDPSKVAFLAVPATPDIKSGMALVREIVNGVPTYRKAVTADATSALSIYIADADADDHDVQAANKLIGRACSDDYVVQTGYHTTAAPWALDDPVAVGDGGFFKKAATGEKIVGIITNIGTNANKTLDIGGLTRSAIDTTVIEFKTVQHGHALT